MIVSFINERMTVYRTETFSPHSLLLFSTKTDVGEYVSMYLEKLAVELSPNTRAEVLKETTSLELFS